MGLLARMQAAGSTQFAILMAGTASVLSGAFSMAAGIFLSSKAEKEIFDHPSLIAFNGFRRPCRNGPVWGRGV